MENIKNKKMRMSKVFTPGGFPTITYVSLKERELEAKLDGAKDYLAKLVILTGATKSGKTVLVDRVFPGSEHVWIDGGTVESEESFWISVLQKIEAYTDVSINEVNSSQQGFESTIEGSGGIGVINGKVSGNFTVGNNSQNGVQKGRRITPKVAAITALQDNNDIGLIVDDFHYIDKDIQKNIVRALKAPIMRGVPVIFIAIPNRKYDAVNVEREMTGRIENIEMPVWGKNELRAIAEKGFKALNVSVSEAIIEFMAKEAYGSPFLMQEFCKSLCLKKDIKETKNSLESITLDKDGIEEIFIDIAEHNGRPIFNRLKNGPRARTDRKQRHLKNGVVTDIYGLVMEGFKQLKPGVESVNYEQLRNQIRDILEDALPQKNEISRVLDQIAKISYTDESSTPVIDWQKAENIITITDPFFAFFLKWSRD